jgi:hypothetical protein
MAGQGSLFLDNSCIEEISEKVQTYEISSQDALYAQYKNTYKISVSNYFRGKAADSFKNYVTNGAINIISGFLDVTSDLTVVMDFLKAVFYQFEVNENGKIEEETLDYIQETLEGKKQIFEDAESELNAAIGQASQYIATKSLGLGDITSGYSDVKKAVKTIREDLYEIDSELVKSADELYQRITGLNTLIANVMGLCYNDNNEMNLDNIPDISKQEWFEKAGNVTLYLLLQEDPFVYEAGVTTVAEDQWAAGLCSDVYAYAGYSFLSGSYEAGMENGSLFINAKGSIAEANGYAQFTDYLNANASAKFMHGEVDAKKGWSEDYIGYHINAEVGVIDVEGNVVLGSEDLNAYVKGEASVLSADGKVAFEFEDDGEFAIGVDGSASVASAKASGGTTIFSYDDPDTPDGEDKRLLGFDVGVKAELGASFAAYAESKTAFESEYVNVNATTVNLDISFIVGAEVSFTVPTLHFKWPW